MYKHRMVIFLDYAYTSNDILTWMGMLSDFPLCFVFNSGIKPFFPKFAKSISLKMIRGIS